jgi:bifunctional DNA-binding transcriptional regulator/antitoxin component of YhaV-PrlF toxin-antitoxin module
MDRLTTTTIDEDGGILIPLAILDQAGIKVDDPVELNCDEFGITLTKIKANDTDENPQHSDGPLLR